MITSWGLLIDMVGMITPGKSASCCLFKNVVAFLNVLTRKDRTLLGREGGFTVLVIESFSK